MDYKTIFNNTNLSPASKKSYINKMKKVMSLYNNEIPSFDEINNDDSISINNKYAYMNSILAYKKHKGIERNENEQQIYRDVFDKLKIYSNKPTDKQKENNIEYNELINTVDKLINQKKNDEALLLGMYTLIEPLRSNYGDIKIVYDKEDSDIYRENKEDHLYNNKIYLYNLKIKKGDETIINIPIKLLNIIKQSLNENKRNYLFINSKNKPFTNETFSIYANRLLKKIFNKNITLTDLRHIRINNLDMNELTTKDKMDIANKMNHSLLMQDKYRIKYEDKPANDGLIKSLFKYLGY